EYSNMQSAPVDFPLDETTVRELLAAQFPELAVASVRWWPVRLAWRRIRARGPGQLRPSLERVFLRANRLPSPLCCARHLRLVAVRMGNLQRRPSAHVVHGIRRLRAVRSRRKSTLARPAKRGKTVPGNGCTRRGGWRYRSSSSLGPQASSVSPG